MARIGKTPITRCVPAMHILVSCIGSAGDVHPFLAIGAALRRRGHRVELLTSPYFRERVAAAGLDFTPIGTQADYAEGCANPELWHPRRGFAIAVDLVLRRLREGYEAVRERLTPDTVLVGSSLAWNSRCVQEKTGAPGATIHLAPSLMFSAIDPPVWPGLGWFRHLPARYVRVAQRMAERLAIDPAIQPGLNAFRAQIGLPRARRIVSHWQNSPDLVIGAFPGWFAAPQADWPARSTTTGFARWNAGEGAALDAGLAAFLRSGPAPLGITPGSAMAHGRRFLERALAACSQLGLRAVVVTPFRDQLPPRLPDSAHHVGYAAFDLLLPHVCGFVHHGGIGTLAQCLHAGAPQLIAPFAHDQHDNAARAMRLGVATTVAPNASANTWTRALHGLLNDRRVAEAARHWAQRSRDAAPAETVIAQHIETLRRA